MNLRRQPVDYDVASLTRGIGDQMAGKPQMDKPALDAAMADLQSQTRANRDRARIAAGEKARPSHALAAESYAADVGEKPAIEADPTTLLRGLKDILSGEKPLMTADVAQKA